MALIVAALIASATAQDANMILLEASPLDDISNKEKRAGVMTRGRWMPEAELKKMLDEIAPRFQTASAVEK